MKTKGWIILGIIAVVAIWAVSGYNGLVTAEEGVNGKISEVENAYKRRADLIPNLVETAKKYMDYEGTVLKEVTEARAAAQSNIDLSNATPEQVEAYIKAQDNLGGTLGKLIAVAENYPELKANENFLKLQDELSGTENRIAIARRDWIEATKQYNTSIRRFPKNILASLFGFDAKNYFEATEAEKATPDVGALFSE